MESSIESEEILEDILETDNNEDTSIVEIVNNEDTSNLEAINNEDTSTTVNIIAGPLPSQYLQEFDNIFSLGGQEFQLNSSGTKRLVVGICSREVPELKVVFKLHDIKNGWSIQFSRRTWDAIMCSSDTITSCLEDGVFDEILDDDRIKVSTTTMYNRFCVVFTDRSEVHIVMMPETFNTMLCLKEEIDYAYTELHKNIKDVSKRLKLFMDLTFFHLFKSNNVDCRHNYNWLSLFLNKSANFLELNKAIATAWQQLGQWVGQQQEGNLNEASTSTANDD